MTATQTKDFWLEHPKKVQAVIFRPLPDGKVRFRKKFRDLVHHEEVMELDAARRRYQWYVGLGYQVW